MSSRCRTESGGFTLIEVLIAMFILGLLSLGIYQAMTGTFKLRDSLMTEGDFYNNIRMAMGVAGRDIEMMYTPLVMMPQPSPSPSTGVPARPAGGVNGAPFDETGLTAATAGDLVKDGTFWAAAIDKSGMRPMRFTGTPEKMSFVSLSHLRLYKDSPESELAAVTYLLTVEEHPVEGQTIEGTKVFTKVENVDVFDIDDTRSKTFARSYPILPGVSKLAFQYCAKETQTGGTVMNCKKEWDSIKVDPPNSYPDLIKIQVEVKGQQHMFFEGTYEFRPEVPLHGINPST